ncbi:MAG: site-specific DNA-methyltransferase [Anaerolineae bacterium]|nr:site-specific DNA-methyltransferase [Anaerolineae bacterium]
MTESKYRAPRNRTLTLSSQERAFFQQNLLHLTAPAEPDELVNRTIHQNLDKAIPFLPERWVDLLIIDPPYNLRKEFGSATFQQVSDEKYSTWVESWLLPLIPMLKPTASVYVCGDWQSSPILYFVLKRVLRVRNRITWERDKGRGAKTNWKNSSEDIWFCTVSDTYTFNLDAVKIRRKVIAPYRDENGSPKDWDEADKTRLTHPSNLWTDITVPFWSMPENTDHPTQKPEKLLARLILASSNPGEVVFDPFLGSGTTSVVAKKLNRRYVGIEMDMDYACLAEKRLALAEENPRIQGYRNGVFQERNT